VFECLITLRRLEGPNYGGVEDARVNPKHESGPADRNKFKCSKKAKFKTNTIWIHRFGFSGFEIYFGFVCFGFRISNFGFSLGFIKDSGDRDGSRCGQKEKKEPDARGTEPARKRTQERHGSA
jgi:hypothetical protein